MKLRWKKRCLALCAVLALGGAANYRAGWTGTAPVMAVWPASAETAEKAADEAAAGPALSREELALLDAFCQQQGDGFSLAVYDLTAGESYTYNAGQYYYAASTLKAPYALWLAQRADTGEIDLDENLPNLFRGRLTGWLAEYSDSDTVPAREALAAMIGNSDNYGLSLLAARWPAGEGSGFAAFAAQQLGMQDTTGCSLTWEGGVQGYTTAADNLAFLQALYGYFESGASNAQWLWQVFCAADHDLLYVPEGVQAAKKYGSWELALHDEMIVYAERPYLIACFTAWGEESVDFPPEAAGVMQQLGKLVYEMIQGEALDG